MIEFRIANHEEGIEEYLTEWGEILQNNRTFYHLYVDGVKKDDTLYVSYSMGDDSEVLDKTVITTMNSYGFTHNVVHTEPKQITNGLILIHKLVESHYTKEFMKKCYNDEKDHDDKYFKEVQVLINTNGVILFEEENYDINTCYHVLSDNLFSIHNSSNITTYYRIDGDSLTPIFEGYQLAESKTCVYGNPISDDRYKFADGNLVYKLNKITHKIEID